MKIKVYYFIETVAGGALSRGGAVPLVKLIAMTIKSQCARCEQGDIVVDRTDGREYRGHCSRCGAESFGFFIALPADPSRPSSEV